MLTARHKNEANGLTELQLFFHLGWLEQTGHGCCASSFLLCLCRLGSFLLISEQLGSSRSLVGTLELAKGDFKKR